MPFTAIDGPESLTFADGRHVRTPDDYRAWYVVHLNPSARGERAPQPIHAHVNHGRWICRCICDNGLLTRPGWGVAYCIHCGNQYHVVVYPSDWQAIEWLLLERPQRAQQNWHPGETLHDLADENIAHAPPVGDAAAPADRIITTNGLDDA